MVKELFKLEDDGKILYLDEGYYYMYILGGWRVRRGNFDVALINKNRNEELGFDWFLFQLQVFKNGTKAKRIASIEIDNPGDFEIRFSNQEDLKVKWSNLPIFSLLFGFISSREISFLLVKE